MICVLSAQLNKNDEPMLLTPLPNPSLESSCMVCRLSGYLEIQYTTHVCYINIQLLFSAPIQV